MEIVEVFEGPIVPMEPKKDSGKTFGEETSPTMARLVAEASGAAAAVLSRWTLGDLVREVAEATERRRCNVMYYI